MNEYICIAPSREMFNAYGESMGMSGVRALYYSIDVGKHRIYRSSMPLEPFYFNGKDINKCLELLVYSTKKEAQEVCDEINEVYGDNFSPVVKEDYK